MRTSAFITASILVLLAIPVSALSGATRVAYAGYANCVLLENRDTRVILEPNCGGRVLEYSRKGRDVLQRDTEQDGWTYKPGGPVIDPCGGRFDIGPETIVPKHPALWVGGWRAEITGPFSARLTSAEDKITGVRIVREFALDRKSSRLSCTQTVRNISRETKEYCYWGRTNLLGKGIFVMPANPGSRFPAGYVMYGPGVTVLSYQPSDSRVRIRDGFLEVTGPPAEPKLGFDSYAGWCAYLLPGDLCFVKKFPVRPDRVYNEITGITFAIYYYRYRGEQCELEPIGPRETLAPGQAFSFTEDWWLLPYAFPADNRQADLKALAEFVGRETKEAPHL